MMLTKPLLRLQIKGFIFTPYLLSTLLMLCCLTLFILLGIWQLHRATEKQQILFQYQQRFTAKPTTINNIKDSNQAQYFPVQTQGYFDNQHNLLMDNRIYKHQIGYQVLTPFLPDNSSQWILVNRGWIQRKLDRKLLPYIPRINGKQTITGMVYFPSQKTFVLKNILENHNYPRIIEKIDFPQLQQWLNYSFTPWIILLSNNIQDHFIRDWHPEIVSPNVNISYAWQWFSFGFVLIIIFIALNTKKVRP